MKVFAANSNELIGECDLATPNTPYYVIRLVDDAGEYRRLKFKMVVHDGVRGIAAEEPTKAALLPGFKWSPGREPPSVVKGGANPVVGKGGGPGAERSFDITAVTGFEAEVVVRLLERLGSTPLVAPGELQLAPDVTTRVELPLPLIPAGNLFWRPASGLTTPLRMVLGWVALEPTEGKVVLELNSAMPLTLAPGAVLGTLESRSPTNPPEGMRAKVFASHLASALREAAAG